MYTTCTCQNLCTKPEATNIALPTHTPARHLHDANTVIMAGTAYQSRHDTSNTVEPGTAPCRQPHHNASDTVEPGTAPCRHQVQAHHNASDTVEPGTAPCRHQVHLNANAIAESGTAPCHHQVHHGAGVTGTAPCHQQACPAAQRLLATCKQHRRRHHRGHVSSEASISCAPPSLAAYNATSNGVSMFHLINYYFP